MTYRNLVAATAVAFVAATGAAVAEQPGDPSGFGQARAAAASSGVDIGGAISSRAKAGTQRDSQQGDLEQYSENENGVRADTDFPDSVDN